MMKKRMIIAICIVISLIVMYELVFPYLVLFRIKQDICSEDMICFNVAVVDCADGRTIADFVVDKEDKKYKITYADRATNESWTVFYDAEEDELSIGLSTFLHLYDELKLDKSHIGKFKKLAEDLNVSIGIKNFAGRIRIWLNSHMNSSSSAIPADLHRKWSCDWGSFCYELDNWLLDIYIIGSMSFEQRLSVVCFFLNDQYRVDISYSHKGENVNMPVLIYEL